MIFKMILNSFSPFLGQHCETTATGSLLKHAGIELSEPMLFGIGEGLGFIYWDMKIMQFPFIGGRIKPDFITRNIICNLDLELTISETSSPKKAWENVKDKINHGIPVGLKLDSYYLDYFTKKVHFAGHYVAMYGYDDENAYLVDTVQQGSLVKTSLKNLAVARSAKGPMSSKNQSYSIGLGCNPYSREIKKVIPFAIKTNAQDFLNPPINNVGYKGIKKTSVEIKNWFQRSNNIKVDFELTALLIERGGTGGALFRNFYRDFLKESLLYINSKNLQKAYDMFVDIAPLWTEVADLIKNAGVTEKQNFLNQASVILLELAEREKTAMELLVDFDKDVLK